jgi:hypothetical protein
MPIVDHELFHRPNKNALLWRYTDLPKFVNLITTSSLWLSNLEILAKDDPYEGLLGSVRFPHRAINSLDEMPKEHHEQLWFDYNLDILQHRFDSAAEKTLEAAFEHWYRFQEAICIRHEAERRDYYINCWHEAEYESIAMWKIYGSPGAGVAVVSSCSRLETALQSNQEKLFLGRVNYKDISEVEIGVLNYFEHLLSKLSNYEYEREVRLAHWSVGESHAPLAKSKWNPVTRRFEDLLDDLRPIQSGLAFACDLDALIERVIVSPFAPPWYLSTVEAIRDSFGFKFPVRRSILLDTPATPDSSCLLAPQQSGAQ